MNLRSGRSVGRCAPCTAVFITSGLTGERFGLTVSFAIANLHFVDGAHRLLPEPDTRMKSVHSAVGEYMCDSHAVNGISGMNTHSHIRSAEREQNGNGLGNYNDAKLHRAAGAEGSAPFYCALHLSRLVPDAQNRTGTEPLRSAACPFPFRSAPQTLQSRCRPLTGIEGKTRGLLSIQAWSPGSTSTTSTS